MQEVWQERVDNYWSKLGSKIKAGTIRNVMDMRANIGSFAAALKEKDVWVMNVVPENQPKSLAIIYDRGLIGAVHNWYDSFLSCNNYFNKLNLWQTLFKFLFHFTTYSLLWINEHKMQEPIKTLNCYCHMLSNKKNFFFFKTLVHQFCQLLLISVWLTFSEYRLPTTFFSFFKNGT